MIVKCEDCGKKYEIKIMENKKNFQCECGGDLKNLSVREIYEQKKGTRAQQTVDKNKKVNIPVKKILKIVFYIIFGFGALIWVVLFPPIGILALILLFVKIFKK